MDHAPPPVASVARPDISGRFASTAASPVPIVPAEPSVVHHQREINHPQGTLEAVPNPARPAQSPPAQSRLARRAPGPNTGRRTSGVSYVPSRFDEATERIEDMKVGACGLFTIWPLDGFIKLLPASWRTRAEEPTPQPQEADNTPQPDDVEDTTQKPSKVLQEDDMMNYTAPPPYHPLSN
ncbi:hypothetical protein FRC00_012901 [Tulasnella sp. 408]|nr:hypothetical protein FRC00_012901 [Tulasnella sp. 408]